MLKEHQPPLRIVSTVNLKNVDASEIHAYLSRWKSEPLRKKQKVVGLLFLGPETTSSRGISDEHLLRPRLEIDLTARTVTYTMTDRIPNNGYVRPIARMALKHVQKVEFWNDIGMVKFIAKSDSLEVDSSGRHLVLESKNSRQELDLSNISRHPLTPVQGWTSTDKQSRNLS